VAVGDVDAEDGAVRLAFGDWSGIGVRLISAISTAELAGVLLHRWG